MKQKGKIIYEKQIMENNDREQYPDFCNYIVRYNNGKRSGRRNRSFSGK